VIRRPVIRRTPALLTALLLSLSACGGDTAPSEPPPPVAESPTVYLRNIEYEPDHVTVEAGTTVEWVWDDGTLQHDVAGDGFKSDLFAEGTFTHTFEEPGTYEYLCTIHPGMDGTVTVVAPTS